MRFSFLNMGLLAAGLLLTASSTEAATPVNCGDVLSVPGQYYLANDLGCSISGGPAVQIAADNVHFDLRGHRILEIDGNNAGIRVDASADANCSADATPLSGIQITNGIVDGFDWGILACHATDLRITNVELVNSNTALELLSVTGADVNASVFTGRDTAVALRMSHDNRFHANRLGGLDGDGCNRGFYFRASSYNIVTGSEISGCNGEAGVVLVGLNGVGSTGNIVRGNLIGGGTRYGILAVQGSTGNIVQANRVYGPTEEADLRDLSDVCDSNTWKANHVATANPPCLK